MRRGGGRGGGGERGGRGGGAPHKFAAKWAAEVQIFPDRDIPFPKPLNADDEFKLRKANQYRAFMKSSSFFQIDRTETHKDLQRYTDRYVPTPPDIVQDLAGLINHPKRCFPLELLSDKPPVRRRRAIVKKANEDSLKTLEGKEGAGEKEKKEGEGEGEGEKKDAGDEADAGEEVEEEDAGDYGKDYYDDEKDDGDGDGDGGGDDEATF
ncbi:hypothetical protein PAPYR_1994 [Paratrimastix pyriformis]|uniref:DNA-directed RNA polymerase III subunit n=1 Tax=Paratrimastix pyriformis TaxID=342808 RepID=A0ABQ8UQJ8_9EUKA|nr:hypothetical protein PAPYR_1994 [Paratrimastix pyriformis]